MVRIMAYISESDEDDGNSEDRDDRDSGIQVDRDSGTQADGNRVRGCLADPSGEGYGTDVATLTVFKALPEDIFEMVVAKLPFPSLYQARCLSKSWYSRFASRPANGLPLSPFQENVALLARKWPKYCPINVRQGRLLGFDNVSRQWRSMPTLSDLSMTTVTRYVTCSGSLIGTMADPSPTSGYRVTVTDVINNNWRRLTELPELVRRGPIPSRYTPREPDHFKILPHGTDGYRVLLLYKYIFTDDGMHALIYDSKLETWTVKESTTSRLSTKYNHSAYLDEKLYCMFGNTTDSQIELWVYDIGMNTWTALPYILTELYFTLQGGVLRCGNKIMVAVGVPTSGRGSQEPRRERTSKNWVRMYELILPSLELRYLSTNPADMIWDRNLGLDIDFSSDADFVYLGCSSPDHAVVTFNVHTHGWGLLPLAARPLRNKKLWVDTAFEPGLNPFVKL